MNLLGIDIGAGSIKAGIVDENGAIIEETNINTSSSMDNQAFERALKSTVDFYHRKYKIDGVGVGSPGPIDAENGIIFSSANLPYLDQFPIKTMLKSILNQDIFFNNDANCACLGEYFFGAGKGSQNLFVFTLGTGLGGGWVWKGQLFNGWEGNGMEVGHTTILKNGAICGCGNRGCAEAYFSATGLINRYFEESKIHLANVKDFFDLVRSMDPVAIQILTNGTEILAEASRNIVNLLNVDTIVFVGGLVQSWDLFGDSLEKGIKNKIFPILRDRLRIRQGKNQAILGAASLVLEQRR
jgi:glucokinase